MSSLRLKTGFFLFGGKNLRLFLFVAGELDQEKEGFPCCFLQGIAYRYSASYKVPFFEQEQNKTGGFAVFAYWTWVVGGCRLGLHLLDLDIFRRSNKGIKDSFCVFFFQFCNLW